MFVKLLLALLALFAAGAAAQSPDAHKRPGYLAKLDERFRAADKNGDGALTRGEAGTAGFHRVVEHFDRIDADGDGKATREEIRTLLRSRIAG